MSSDPVNDEFSVERRKFLAILTAAGVYVPPAAAALLTGAGEAWAQSLSSSGSSTSTVSSISLSTSGASAATSGGTSGSSGSGSSSSSGSTSGTGEISGVGGSGYSTSGSGEISGHRGTTLYAVGDAFIRRQSPDTNEGGNPRIRVGIEPVTRGLVQFDASELAAAYWSGARVQLVLRIASNHNDWGQQDNRTVDAIALLGAFVEGNGKQSGLPGTQAVRGTGAGATWVSPDDPNVADDSPRGSRQRWEGGNNVAPRTAQGAVHVNQQVNVDVAWDVTQDVAGGYSGWLIKIADERADNDDPRWAHNDDHDGHDDDDRRHNRLPIGSDGGYGGTVEYYSREGAAAAGQPGWAPRLVIS